jgi:hypothetical protein
VQSQLLRRRLYRPLRTSIRFRAELPTREFGVPPQLGGGDPPALHSDFFLEYHLDEIDHDKLARKATSEVVGLGEIRYF